MIVKKITTYVSSRNLGLFQGEVHCSIRKLAFPWGIIMFHGEELKLPWRATMFPREQMCSKFGLIIIFAYEF
jgi:hypothetical protein